MDSDDLYIPELEQRLNRVGVSLAKAAKEAEVDWRTAKRAADGQPIRRLSYAKLVQFLERKESAADANVLQMNGSAWTSPVPAQPRRANFETSDPEALLNRSVDLYLELLRIYDALEDFHFSNPNSLASVNFEEHEHRRHKAQRTADALMALVTGRTQQSKE